jgi:glycosyltransferase 2 family protein
MKAALRLLIVLSGLALFVWFVLRAGPGDIWRTALGLGWLAPLALVPYALTYAADTWGWQSAFGRRPGAGVGFFELYGVRWCGEAVNNVLPSGTIGGEASKVYLLQKRGVPAGEGAAAVIVGRTVQTMTQVAFIALGVAAFLHVAPDRPGLQRALALVLALSVAALAALCWLQAQGLFTLLLRLPGCFPGRARLEAHRERLQQIDRQVRQFYRRDRRSFLRCAAGYGGGWLLDSCDVLLVAWLLGLPVTWPQALAVESFVGVAKLVGMLVPGALGAQESGIALVCHYAGLPPALGPAYALIRRGRDLVFAGIGWLLLFQEEGRAGLAGLGREAGLE